MHFAKNMTNSISFSLHQGTGRLVLWRSSAEALSIKEGGGQKAKLYYIVSFLPCVY